MLRLNRLKLGTCESAVSVRIEYESNQKRCAELQIPHSNSQIDLKLKHIKQYRRMITHRASESVYCTTKRR